MNTEIFIAKRIFSLKQQGNLSKPAVKIATTSVALSIAVMIISVAIVTGFQKEIRNKVIGFGAHIQISKYDNNASLESTPINKNQEFYKSFNQFNGIRHVQVYATKAGIAKSGDNMQGIIFKGVGNDYDWSFFKDRIVNGRLFHLNDSSKSKEIIISKNLAEILNLKTGDSLRTYFIDKNFASPKGRKFLITGIYETGLEEFDKVYIIGDIAQIQSLNKWTSDQVGGFEVLINDFNKLDEINDYVYKNIGYELDAKSIKQLNPQLFDWLNLQDMNVAIILTLMNLVAAINMISTLLILILERTRMIGVLKALGSPNKSIRKVFLYTAAFIVGKGLLWGNAIGLSLCFLQKFFGIFTLSQESYYVKVVPIHFDIPLFLLINVCTLIICFSMLIIPSLIISRITPVKAIRFN